MSDFSPSEAALSGFSFIRRHPFVVMAWTGVNFALGLLSSTLMIGLAADKVAAISHYNKLNSSDPDLALAIMPSLLVAVLILGGGNLALGSVMFSAAYRAHLQKRSRLGGSWYREVRPGVYELETGNLRLTDGDKRQRVFTRRELEQKFGFAP